MNCFMSASYNFDINTNCYFVIQTTRVIHSSGFKMATALLFCLIYVQFIGMLAKIQYNTLEPVISSRVTEHIPSVKLKSCLLLPTKGPCRGNINMYYYNPSNKSCDPFQWGGCQGNGNRYDSRNECLSTCLTSGEEKPTSPRYCSLAFDYGYCFGSITRWYYDRYWKVCKHTIYSGCGGNKNNFYTFGQCDRICRLGKAPIMRAATRAANSTRKVLYINPKDATPKRGQNQTTRTPARIITKSCTNSTSKGRKDDEYYYYK